MISTFLYNPRSIPHFWQNFQVFDRFQAINWNYWFWLGLNSLNGCAALKDMIVMEKKFRELCVEFMMKKFHEILCCISAYTVHPIEYTLSFVVFCFVVVILLLFVVDSCDLAIHILQGYFTGTGVIIWLLGQSYDCPSASEVTLKDNDLGKIGQYQTTHRNGKVVRVTALVSLGTLKLAFIFSIDDQGSHVDNLSISVQHYTTERKPCAYFLGSIWGALQWSTLHRCCE